MQFHTVQNSYGMSHYFCNLYHLEKLMQTAIHAEVTSCGVTWGFRPRAELETFHPNYIIDKAEEVLEIVFR